MEIKVWCLGIASLSHKHMLGFQYYTMTMIVKCSHLKLQCTFGLNYAQLLEPICFFASPKPEETDGNRRSLKDSKLLLSQPSSIDGCRVSVLAILLPCKLCFLFILLLGVPHCQLQHNSKLFSSIFLLNPKL